MFVRYISIQLIAYLIDFGGFVIAVRFLGQDVFVSNIFAKLAAGLFAFFCHRRFTFAVEDSGLSQAVRYFALLTLNIPVSSAVLGAFLWMSGQTYVAKFISDIVIVALTYLISKHVVFKKNASSPVVSGEGAER